MRPASSWAGSPVAVYCGGVSDEEAPVSIELETEVLLFFLNRLRNAVVDASAGLTDEQQRTPGVPSGTNLLGLIRHLAAVEQHWFVQVFLGRDCEIDDSMRVPVQETHARVVRGYRRACAKSDEIVRAAPDLTVLAQVTTSGSDGPVSLRRIVAHMIEETGRHAGHADILRERIDGTTGL